MDCKQPIKYYHEHGDTENARHSGREKKITLRHCPKIDKNEGKRKEGTVTILTTADFTVIIIERHSKPHVSHLGWFI